MANLTRNDWSLGWFPSQDRSNGDKRGLLRMDNLCLNEHNVLSLANGYTKINTDPFGSSVHTCYSKLVENTKWRYVGLDDGSVRRSDSNTWATETEVIGAGEGEIRACFDSSLGAIFAFSGTQRKREIADFVTGELVTYDITPETPATAPIVLSVNQPSTDIVDWTDTGNILLRIGGNLVVDSAAKTATFDTILTLDGSYSLGTLAYYPGAIDTRPEGSSQYGLDDGFQMDITIPDTGTLTFVSVSFLLKKPVGSPDNNTNVYRYIWYNNEESPFTQGYDAETQLTANRKDFERLGGDPVDWKDVVEFQVHIRTNLQSAALQEGIIVHNPQWLGGEQGEINGLYDYIQVNVSDNGGYIAKSVKSEPIKDVYVFHGYTTIQPVIPTDEQVNKIYLYRRSSDYETADLVPPGSKPRLAYWYKVAEIYRAPASTFPTEIEDRMSDLDAVTLNQTYNDNLVSTKDYPEEILSIIASYNGRAIYMTWKEILFSDMYDPGLVDNSITVKLSGDKFQSNLWMKRTHPNQFYIATTNELYVLQGTLGYLADGTADITITGLGLDVVPISSDVDEDKGILYFLDAEGWKAISGAEVRLISTQTELLYQGKDRYGIGHIQILPRDQTHYPVTIAKGKLWAGMPHADGSRYVHVYDFVKQYWYAYWTNPICFFTEEDGTVLAGYGGGDNYLRIFDDPASNLIDGGLNQSIYFETIADNDGLSRNRKDPFTLKIIADSGGLPVTIAIAKDGSDQYYVIGDTTFDGKTEKLITIAESIGPAKQFALKLYSTGVTTFKLYEFTIEYDPRPEQLTYIHIPNTNLGTVSRKRFVNYAFVIDTLDQDCEFIPLIDNVIAGSSSVFQTPAKQTYIHYFYPTTLTDAMQSEFVGTDIGGIICGLFEYYGPNLEEIVSEKLPVPVKSMLIPGNDYGIPNRKRHSSYKFQINTRGQRVQYTPRVDQTWYSPVVYTTTEKQTVEYFFGSDTIGIDIGGRLDSLDDIPFEFYGTIVPQDIETLPPRLRYFRIPENNFGIAAKKRIRTMPMVINTNGQNVTFTPIVDNVRGTPTIINTPVKQTTFHYFDTDSFGIDYSGDLTAVTDTPFEFYKLEQLEAVEALPVGKKFDQVGPLRFDRLAKFHRLRLRAITEETSIPIKILTETEETVPNSIGTTGVYTTTFKTIPNVDDVWEIVLPKTIMGTIIRAEIGPLSSAFHRFDLQVLCSISGLQSSQKWLKFR